MDDANNNRTEHGMNTNEIDIGLVADSGLGLGSELPLGCTEPPDSIYEYIDPLTPAERAAYVDRYGDE